MVLQGISLSENNICAQNLWLPHSAIAVNFFPAIDVNLCKLPASWGFPGGSW